MDNVVLISNYELLSPSACENDGTPYWLYVLNIHNLNYLYTYPSAYSLQDPLNSRTCLTNRIHSLKSSGMLSVITSIITVTNFKGIELEAAIFVRWCWFGV